MERREVGRVLRVIVLLVLAAVVVVGGLAAGIAALAARSKRNVELSNQVVPGRPTRAPASWAGSHDAEAILHRRLRDAMAALRANQAFDDDGGLLDLRVELEEQTIALDDRLVAVAALPRLRRGDPLAEATRAVDTIETAVAELASRSAADAVPALRGVLERIRERDGLLGEIQAELDRLPAEAVDPTPPASAQPIEPGGSDQHPGPDQAGEPGQPGTSTAG